MKRILTGILFFFTLFLHASAEDGSTISNTDSSEGYSRLLHLAQQLVFKNPDSAQYLIDKAILSQNTLDDERSQSKVFYLLGNINLVKGQYPKAVEYYEKSLQITQEYGDSARISDLYSNIGIAYARMGDQETYLAYLLKTLDIDRKMGNEHMIAADYNNIGNVYLNTHEPHEALSYYRKALEYNVSRSDSSLLYAIYGNISNFYHLVEKYDSAKYYSQKAIQVATLTGNNNELGTAYGNMALLYSKLQQYDSAIHYYDVAINLMEEIGANRRLAALLNDKSHLLIKLNDAAAAITLSSKSLAIGHEEEDRVIEAEASKNLSLAYESLGDYESALKYHKSYLLMNDSLNLTSKDAELQKLIRRFEVNEKKREIRQLEIENEFEKSRNRLLAISFFMLVIFLTVLFFKNRKLNRSYHLLLDKQKQLAGIKPSPMDSIRSETEETEEQKQLIIKLEQLLKQKKIFLESEISLDALAEILNTNRNTLSALINLHYQKNFNMLINEYRINEVLRLFAENHHNRYTMEAISKQVGFGSRASFNAVFKKVTGVTPTFYIKNL